MFKQREGSLRMCTVLNVGSDDTSVVKSVGNREQKNFTSLLRATYIYFKLFRSFFSFLFLPRFELHQFLLARFLA